MAGTATHQIAVLAVMGTDFISLETLAKKLPSIPRNKINQAVCRLITRGYVERFDAGEYRLTLTGGEFLASGATLKSGSSGRKSVPRTMRDTLQQRAWTAMRLNNRFALENLATLVARDGDANVIANLQRYCNRLTSAGYLMVLHGRVKGNAPTSPGCRQWCLMRDTGALAPGWDSARKRFLDRNTREVIS